MSIAGDSSSTESGLPSDQDSDSTIYDLTTSRLEVREEDNNESREDDRQRGLTQWRIQDGAFGANAPPPPPPLSTLWRSQPCF